MLERILNFACAVIPCDSCFVYTVEGDKLLLRASKNPHAEVVDKLNVGRAGRHRVGGAAPRVRRAVTARVARPTLYALCRTAGRRF